MTTMKSLAITVLLVGGTSLAMAQNAPPPTGGQPPAATPAPQATAPSPYVQSSAPPPPVHQELTWRIVALPTPASTCRHDT